MWYYSNFYCTKVIFIYIIPIKYIFFYRLIQKFGLENSGLLGIWIQNFCNFIAICCFLFVDQNIFFVYLFLFFIIISRIGLWTFDLVEVQIMQEYIQENQRGIINGVESSLTNLAYLIIFGIATIFHKPKEYFIIVFFSYIILFISSILYTIWVKNFKLKQFQK